MSTYTDTDGYDCRDKVDFDERTPMLGNIQRSFSVRVEKIGKKAFSPVRLLMLFIVINFLTYYDRGALSSTLAFIAKDKDVVDQTQPLPPQTHGLVNQTTCIYKNFSLDTWNDPCGAEECKNYTTCKKECYEDIACLGFFITNESTTCGEDLTCSLVECGSFDDYEGCEYREPEGNQTHVVPSTFWVAFSSLQQGLLGSAFMVGFMIFSPIFANAASYVCPTYLMGLGLIIWILSVIFAASAVSYPMLVLMRTGAGFGEASFVGLAPKTIFDAAPPNRRTLWMALFSSCILVGQAAGISLGALIA
eukprot:gene3052-3602_t